MASIACNAAMLRRILCATGIACAANILMASNSYALGNTSITQRVNACANIQTDLNGIAIAADGSRLFVTDAVGDRMIMIDSTRGKVIGNVRMSGIPDSIAIAPDGTKVYVPINRRITTEDARSPAQKGVRNAGIWGAVVVLSPSTGTIVSSMPLGPELLHEIVISPNSRRAYVTAGERSGKLIEIDTKSATVVGVRQVGEDPSGLAITSDGARLYVANGGPINDRSVSLIDTARNGVLNTIGIPEISGTVVAPQPGSRIYVAVGRGIAVVNRQTDQVMSTIHFDDVLSLSPERGSILVMAGPAKDGGGTISVVDTSTDAILFSKSIKSGAKRGVTSPDGKRAFVLGYGGAITVFDLQTKSILDTINVPPPEWTSAAGPSCSSNGHLKNRGAAYAVP